LRWQGPAVIANSTAILSREGVTHINKFTTDNNKDLDMGLRWVLDAKTDWPIDHWSHYDFFDQGVGKTDNEYDI
jgi:hypothetical protein